MEIISELLKIKKRHKIKVKMMNGFEFTPTWVANSMEKAANGRTKPHPSLDMSYQYQAERFHAAPFEPAFIMKEGFGDQNSATLSPLNPAVGGIFGPVFGFLGPEVCAGAVGVGPIADRAPVSGSVFRGAGGFPNPAVGRCMPVQDKPYV
jgi:hypothetical protein